MSREELFSGDVILVKVWTNVRLSQTGPNLLPVPGVGDVASEPLWEATELVLLVGSAGDGVGPVRARDDEGEDEEDEEEADEDGHATEVEGEEALAVPVGADEAGEGNEEDEGAEDDDGPAEEVGALAVGLVGEPDAGGDDGDGGQEGHEVEDCRYVVAHSHGSEDRSIWSCFSVVWKFWFEYAR